LQVVLNKKEKEELVAKLYQDGKPIRQIAKQAHLSFGTIGKIIKRLNGENNDAISSDMNNKSKATQALNLFLHGKRPVEVAIELDLSSTEVENILQEYWVLTKLDELACIYPEIRNHLDQFLNLFHIMKKNRLINQKDIQVILGYAADLPSLENKFRSLANTVLDLEIKKKELSAQLTDLAQVINQYQSVIYSKKQQRYAQTR
jgi:DNA-binding Lrp family transcriptional regulator